MTKRHKQPPALGAKSWVIFGLIGLSLVMMLIVNDSYARQSAERIACHDAQRKISAGVERLQKSSPGALSRNDPKDTPALLMRSGVLASLPLHPGTPPGKEAPWVFGKDGALYCTVHGAEGSLEK